MQGLEWDIRNEAEKLQPRGSSQPEATTMPQPKSKKKKSGPAVPFVGELAHGHCNTCSVNYVPVLESCCCS